MFYILVCLFLIVVNNVQGNEECPVGSEPIPQCSNDNNTSSLTIFNYSKLLTRLYIYLYRYIQQSRPPLYVLSFLVIKSDDRDLDGWMVCPRVDSTISQWHISVVVDNSDIAITNGVYCANILYDIQQMCSDTNGILRINHTNLPNNTGGVLQLLFTSSVLTINITIRSSMFLL